MSFISFLLSSRMEIRARHNNKLLRFTLNHPGYVFTERQHSPTGPCAVSSLNTERKPSSPLFWEAQKKLWRNQWKKKSRRERNTWKQYLFTFVLHIQKFQANLTCDTETTGWITHYPHPPPPCAQQCGTGAGGAVLKPGSRVSKFPSQNTTEGMGLDWACHLSGLHFALCKMGIFWNEMWKY